VIAHDRHLLRSVCDELVIVHDGGAERFDRSLDDYSDWLRERESAGRLEPQDESAAPGETMSRKQQRQAQALQRQRLKPLRDRVRAIETEMERCRKEVTLLDERLMDEKLYSDPGRVEETSELSRQRSAARERIQELEWEWLEASEALEAADSPAEGQS